LILSQPRAAVPVVIIITTITTTTLGARRSRRVPLTTAALSARPPTGRRGWPKKELASPWPPWYKTSVVMHKYRHFVPSESAMKPNQASELLRIAQKAGVLRARDLQAHGIPRSVLQRLYERGILSRVGRGLYVLSDAKITENHTLAEVSKRVPGGVVCLLSALQFHGLTTQVPFEVWLALGIKGRRPKEPQIPLRVVRFSEAALRAGAETHQIEGVPVKVYDPAKTVVDCFKYRNKVGLEVALEALRDCRRQRKCTNDELWKYAKICRMTNVMRPYLEALTIGIS